MTDHEQRDAEILRRREEGVPYREIGQQFGISHGRVRQIVSRFERKQKWGVCSESLRAIIRSVNNIEKRWPSDFIVDALLLEGRPRLSVERLLENRHATKLRLKDLMDFLIADTENLPFNRLHAMPAYRQQNVGIKTYSALVDHLSGLDLGEAFNTEWAKRLKKLMRHLSTTGQYVPVLLRKHLEV